MGYSHNMSLVGAILIAYLHFSYAQNAPQDYVNAHNQARKEVGVGPVKWDAKLAKTAENEVNKLKTNCTMRNSTRFYENGENLATGGGQFTGTDAVKLWISKKALSILNHISRWRKHKCFCNTYANLQFPVLVVHLDRYNYSLWHGIFCSTLKAYELDSFLISNTDPSSTLVPKDGSTYSIPNPTFATWKRKDKLVLLCLLSTLINSLLAMWPVPPPLLRFGLCSNKCFMHKLEQARCTSNNNFRHIRKDFVSFLLFGIDPEYGSFKSALNIHVELITSNDLLGLLLFEEQHLEDDNTSSLSSANVVAKSPSAGHSSVGLGFEASLIMRRAIAINNLVWLCFRLQIRNPVNDNTYNNRQSPNRHIPSTTTVLPLCLIHGS
ncbi:hypothetical protein L6452_22927 [Arctium lappa]|uniref:Uncharacterized protein n=1 Tax=Arctium lappa TaxID=4217 RepID=A0ACB9B1Z6_ARCLA|nr:hypothetical protein L6452_22927 [Arctium lappa]